MPGARSRSWTGFIASAFFRCASRGLVARDSAVTLIQARSGTACTTPSPAVTTVGCSRGGAGCCADAAIGVSTSRKAVNNRVSISVPYNKLREARVEVSEVRRQLRHAIDRAKARAQQKRQHAADGERAYAAFLEDIPTPTTRS